MTSFSQMLQFLWLLFGSCMILSVYGRPDHYIAAKDVAITKPTADLEPTIAKNSSNMDLLAEQWNAYDFNGDVKVIRPGKVPVIVNPRELTLEFCLESCRDGNILVCYEAEFPLAPHARDVCDKWGNQCGVKFSIWNGKIRFMDNGEPKDRPMSCVRSTMSYGYMDFGYGFRNRSCLPKINHTTGYTELSIQSASASCPVLIKNAKLWVKPTTPMPTTPSTSTAGFNIWIVVGIVIFVGIILLACLGIGGWLWIQKEKEKKKQQSTPSAKKPSPASVVKTTTTLKSHDDKNQKTSVVTSTIVKAGAKPKPPVVVTAKKSEMKVVDVGKAPTPKKPQPISSSVNEPLPKKQEAKVKEVNHGPINPEESDSDKKVYSPRSMVAHIREKKRKGLLSPIKEPPPKKKESNVKVVKNKAPSKPMKKKSEMKVVDVGKVPAPQKPITSTTEDTSSSSETIILPRLLKK